MRSYGVDDYSRYIENDGERFLVEPYPWPWRAPHLWLRSLVDITIWHCGVLHEHGVAGWRKLRAL